MPTAPEPRRRALRIMVILTVAAGLASCADTSRQRYYRAHAAVFSPAEPVGAMAETPHTPEPENVAAASGD